MLFTADNTASFEAMDSMSNTDVAMKKIGNNTLKITCDVMVDWPILTSIVNPPLIRLSVHFPSAVCIPSALYKHQQIFLPLLTTYLFLL